MENTGLADTGASTTLSNTKTPGDGKEKIVATINAKTGACAKCGVAAQRRCVCRVAYCSEECQRLDWPRHKPRCPPYVVKDSGQEGKGRGLFASRNLPAYSVVLVEEPVLVADRSKAGDGAALLAAFRKLSDAVQTRILRLHDPQTSVDLVADEAENLIHKLLRIMKANSCLRTQKPISYKTTDIPQNCTQNLYLDNASINHSCAPNCCWRPDEDENFLTVMTLVPVKKGSEITVNYYFNNDEDRGQFCLTHEQRSVKVAESYRFKCLCSECNQTGKNDNLRLLYQQLDLQLEPGFNDIDSTIKVLKTAESKLELGRALDHQVLFRDLMDCLIPLRCLMEINTMEAAECSPEVMAEYTDKFEKMKIELLRVGAVIPKQFIRKVKSMLRLE